MPPATEEEDPVAPEKIVIKLRLKVAASSSSTTSEPDNNPENCNICPECKKIFPSPKSLYGHLRSHPNRGYRGVIPPKNKRGGGGGGSTEDQILAWPRRTKRARSRYDAKEEEESEKETEAAMTLKILSMGPQLDHHTRNGSSVVAKKCYQCTTCNRSFSTHQALGGHMASHNKHKHSSEVETHRDVVEPNETIATVRSSLHQCEQCGKIFGSGQALGGHKREHYGKSTTGHRTAMVTNERRTDHQVLNDFDLNEPPRSDAGEI